MQAWLHAMQARMSSLRPLRRLVGHLRVADHRPRHAAHVGLAGGDDRLRLLGLVDAPAHEDRLADARLHRGRVGSEVGVAHRHRGHDVHRASEAGGGAGDHVEVVESRLVVQRRADREHLFRAQALRAQLVARDPDPHHHLVADLRADVVQDLAHDAKPILRAAAVLVAAQVDPRIEELREQVAHAAQDLAAVDPGLPEAARGVAVSRNDVVHQRARHRRRHDVEAFVGHRGGRPGRRRAAVQRFQDLAARVEELRKERCPVLVRGVREAPVAGGSRRRGRA